MVNSNNPLDDAVERLFAALPVQGGNQVGITARNVMVNRMKGATPGQYSSLFGGGKRFINIFFPSYRPAAYEDAISGVTGLDNSLWSDMSIAVLCEAMYNLTSDLRPQLLINNIENDINSEMGRIFSAGAAWYGYLLPRVSQEVQAAYGAIPADKFPQVLAIYSDSLKSPKWIQAKLSQYHSGTWPNRDWELYHHWIKLQILGASIDTINGIINYLISQGIPVPESVNANNWRQYNGWCSSRISWQDIRSDASSGILEEICTVYPGSTFPCCMKENNSFEFTANSQPGSKYREVPHGCCFKAGTLVLMADSTLRPIEEIKAGEQVMTPIGPKMVVLVSAPLRLKRTLYKFENLDFQFTGTHPFLAYALSGNGGAPTFACVDPMRLTHMVPALSQLGVAPIRAGSNPALCKFDLAGLQPFNVPNLIAQKDGSESEVLYDLILDMQGNGVSEYYVGDRNVLLLVSSEIPRYGIAPETAQAILAMLEGCSETVLETLKDVPDKDFTEFLNIGMKSVASRLLPSVLRQIEVPQISNVNAFDFSTDQLHELVSQAISSFVLTNELTDEPIYQRRFGYLLEYLASTFGLQFMSAIDLGWRDFTLVKEQMANMLSVSVYCIEMDGTLDMPASVPLILRIELVREGSRFNYQLPSFTPTSKHSYYHQFDEVAYFNMWRPLPEDATADASWTVKFDLLRSDNNDIIGGTTFVPLPMHFKCGFYQRSSQLMDKTGHDVGRVNFDMRPINKAVLEKEEIAKKMWTPGKRHAMALTLGAAAGEYVNQSFSLALNLFARSGLINPPPIILANVSTARPEQTYPCP